MTTWVGDDVAQEIKPEERNLCQHTAFLRNARGKHVIKGRDAVGGNEKKMLGIEFVHVADFAAGVKLEFREIGAQQDRIEELGAHV